MKYIPSNTLAHYFAAPQFNRIDLSQVPISTLGRATRTARGALKNSNPDPTKEALTFYGQNHLVSLIKDRFTLNEPLPDWAASLVRDYTATVSSQGDRLTHYILSIITREARHWNKAASYTPGGVGKITESWKKEFSKPLADYLVGLAKKDEDQAVDSFMNISLDKVTAEEYIRSIVYTYNEFTWDGSYGGKKWGEIAQTAYRFIKGEISQEVLIDTGFTLAHNGGPMFNKGMFYQSPDNAMFLTLLDIQSGGQVPQAIKAAQAASSTTTYMELSGDYYNPKLYKSPLIEAIKEVEMGLGVDFGHSVDWAKVEAAMPFSTKDKYYDLVQKAKGFVVNNYTFEIVPGEVAQAYGTRQEASKADSNEKNITLEKDEVLV